MEAIFLARKYSTMIDLFRYFAGEFFEQLL